MSLVLEVAAVVVAALVLAALVPRVSSRPRAKGSRHSVSRPDPLQRIERVVGAGRQSAGDVQVRVRPLLREIALPLLRREGVRLDSEPQRAKELLGVQLWEVVRPDRPRPQDRRAPGLTLSEFEQLVRRLERL